MPVEFLSITVVEERDGPPAARESSRGGVDD
jgi:hypothetical protein